MRALEVLAFIALQVISLKLSYSAIVETEALREKYFDYLFDQEPSKAAVIRVKQSISEDENSRA